MRGGQAFVRLYWLKRGRDETSERKNVMNVMKKIAAMIVVMGMTVAVASAAIIDFEGVSEWSLSSHTEEGFLLEPIDATSFELTERDGIKGLVFGFGPAVRLTESSGSPFTLSNLHIDFIWGPEDVSVSSGGNVLVLSQSDLGFLKGDVFFDETWAAVTEVVFASSTATSGQTFITQIEVEAIVENAVPEPATMLLFGTGLIGLAGFRRKKFKK